ncbi:MAG: SRPBCC family protein [Verrucomicrobiota bacterium]
MHRQPSQERRGRLSRTPSHQGSLINVSEGERQGSIYAGIALMLLGFIRRGFSGVLLGGLGSLLLERGITGHCSMYENMGVSSAGGKSAAPRFGQKVERNISINRPREQVFAFWRDFRNLPRFMEHVERVDILDDQRSHWVVKAPGGGTVEWDARIINEHPNEMIAWESLPGAEVENSGSVWFTPAPDGRGTQIKVSFQYNPPGGMLGKVGAWLFGESPEQQIEQDLARLKNVLEGRETAGAGAGVQTVTQRSGR